METNHSDNHAFSIYNNPYAHLYYSDFECDVIALAMSMLSVVGSLFNTCVLVVYGGKRNKCTFEVFVFFLASINLCGSLLAMPLETFVVWSKDHVSCNSPPDYLIVVTMVLECSSILCLLNIAVDRYFSICWPTHVFITEKRAKWLCSAVVLIAMLLGTIPLFLSNRLLEIHLFYSIAAAIVMLAIIFLYILVFLKVRSTAYNFRRNRSLAVHRSLVNNSTRKSTQHSNLAYSAPGSLKKGTRNSASLLTVDPSVRTEGRLCTEPRNQSISVSQISEHSMVPSFRRQSKCSERDAAVGVSGEKLQVEAENVNRNPSIDITSLTEQTNSRKRLNKRTTRQPTRSTSEKGLHDAMQNRTAKILTIITLCYTLCFLPTSVINFVFYICPDVLLKIPRALTQLIKYLQLLYILNFVISPTVYSIFSESFRKDGAALTAKLKRRLTNNNLTV